MMLRFFVPLLLALTDACSPSSVNDWDPIPPQKEYWDERAAPSVNPHACKDGDGNMIFLKFSENGNFTLDCSLGENIAAAACADKKTRQIYWIRYSMKTREKCNHEKTFPWNNLQMEHVKNVESVYKKMEPKLGIAQVMSHCEYDYDKFKKATFLYVNTAPMEKKLMEGNWKMLGEYLREKVGKEVAPQTIVGTIGQKEVLEGKVTVPKEWFRIVEFTKLKKLLVFIGENEENEKPICTTATECGFKPEVGKGRMYCCEFTQDLGKKLDVEIWV